MPSSEKEILNVFAHMINLDLKINNVIWVQMGDHWEGNMCKRERGKEGLMSDEYDRSILYM
jgi:hypothetical protein